MTDRRPGRGARFPGSSGPFAEGWGDTLGDADGLRAGSGVGIEWNVISPIGFVLEEVPFRGALDPHPHQGESGAGRLSATFVCRPAPSS